MFSVVRPHLRAGGGAQQRKLKRVPVHADAVLAVIEHGGAVIFIAEGAVPLRADFEPVRIIQSGTVGRALHITELDLIDSFRGFHSRREFHLQKAVQLSPVHMRAELKPSAAFLQNNILGEYRFRNPPLGVHDCLESLRAGYLNAHGLIQLQFLQNIVGIDIPGIEESRYVLIHQQMVHGACRELASALLQNKGYKFSSAVNERADLPIFNDDSILRNVSPGCRTVLLFRFSRGRFQGNASAGGNGHQSLHGAVLFHRPEDGSVCSLRSAGILRRKIHKPGSLKGQGIEYSHTLSFCQRAESFFLYLLRLGNDPAVIRPRILIHPRDRRSRKDIVELVQEKLLPGGIHLFKRILIVFLRGGGGAPDLRFAKRQLAPFLISACEVNTPRCAEKYSSPT